MRRRPSKSLLDTKRRNLAFLKKRRDELLVIIEGKTSPFWKRLDAEMAIKEANLNERLDAYIDFPERDVAAMLEQRRSIRIFRASVNDSEDILLQVDTKIADLEVEIREMSQGKMG